MSQPPRRTLDRPPSERYTGHEAGGEVAPPRPGLERRAEATPADGPSGWMSELGAVATAVVTALLLVIVGGILSSTAGLLFISGGGGALVGLLLAGSRLPRRVTRWLAVGLVVAAVVAGAVGTWLFALGEGGALGLVDFLWATTGVLVPTEAIVATVAAAWGLRAGPIRD